MLSRTSEYALRALIYLAQRQKEWPVPGNEIAKHAGIPAKYLSAILSSLVRVGVLESTRGKSGGFAMVRTPKKTRLLEVLEPFEPLLAGQKTCPFGNSECSDANPCLGHNSWKRVLETHYEFLRKTTIHDVAVGKQKRSKSLQPK